MFYIQCSVFRVQTLPLMNLVSRHQQSAQQNKRKSAVVYFSLCTSNKTSKDIWNGLLVQIWNRIYAKFNHHWPHGALQRNTQHSTSTINIKSLHLHPNLVSTMYCNPVYVIGALLAHFWNTRRLQLWTSKKSKSTFKKHVIKVTCCEQIYSAATKEFCTLWF